MTKPRTAGLASMVGSRSSPAIACLLIPRHVAKAYADVTLTSRASLDIGVIGISGSMARGNENNRHKPDGAFYLGDGSIGGYVVTNLGIRYQVARPIELIAQINNLFDTEYSTASQLGPTGFTEAGNFIARPFPSVGGEFPIRQTTFEAPGAPRTFWIGLRIRP